MIRLILFCSLLTGNPAKQNFLEQVFNPKSDRYIVFIPIYSKPGQKEILVTNNHDFYDFNKNNPLFKSDTIAYLKYIKEIFSGNIKLSLPKPLYSELYKSEYLTRKNKFIREALREKEKFINKYSFPYGNQRQVRDPQYADDSAYILAAFFELHYFIGLGQHGFYIRDKIGN